MYQTIKGCFETRRGAELAVEHLVQEMKLDRTTIFVAAAGDRNSAGSKPAGADAASHDRQAEAALGNVIEVSVDVAGERAEAVRRCLEETGAIAIDQG